MVGLFKLAPGVPAYRPLLITPRPRSSKLIAAFIIFSVLYVVRFFRYLPEPLSTFPALRRTRSSCAPRDWAAGKWVPKPPPTNRTDFIKEEDALEFLGFQGCASTREFYWHLGSANSQLFDRFPGVASWKWQPAPECDIDEPDSAMLVKDLVEQGGWLLVGGEFSVART